MKSRLAILSTLLGVVMVYQGVFALDPRRYQGGFYDGYALSATSEYYRLNGSLPISLARYVGGVYDGYGTATSMSDISLPVTLSSFTAETGDGSVTLRWVTESEASNLGFRVYRSLEKEGEYTRLTSKLIEGAGTATGRRNYIFTDIRLTNGVTYWYKLEDIAFDGTTTMHGPISVIPQIGKSKALPTEFSLSQNFPNPFNPTTEILYELPAVSPVVLEVYNELGQKVEVLVDGVVEAGYHSVVWDAKDKASGVYFVRIEVGESEFIEVRKMVLCYEENLPVGLGVTSELPV